MEQQDKFAWLKWSTFSVNEKKLAYLSIFLLIPYFGVLVFSSSSDSFIMDILGGLLLLIILLIGSALIGGSIAILGYLLIPAIAVVWKYITYNKKLDYKNIIDHNEDHYTSKKEAIIAYLEDWIIYLGKFEKYIRSYFLISLLLIEIGVIVLPESFFLLE